MTDNITPFWPRKAAKKTRRRTAGYLSVTNVGKGVWWVDHTSASGDSVGVVSRPFWTKAEASREMQRIGRQFDCEVIE